ncbi:MAG: serine hydrolase [Clostridia bacterium]|nr:serine hydrolase [Clostridia bacterium]
MEKWKKRSVDLIASLYFGTKEATPSVIPYYPQKVEVSSPEIRYFKRHSPERVGISSKRIYNMLAELESERRANIHNLMVIKDGVVISECSRDGYDINTWHLSHSMSKTVTGIVIGALFDEGLIRPDMRLIDIFPELPYNDRRFADVTVHHLLTMRSGVEFSEAGAITEERWTEAFFASILKFAPGTAFNYNSMNSYVLARVAERVSGEPFSYLLYSRLFAPLKIQNYLWEKSPEGTEKGGWGMYLSAESWAKLGMLILNGGVFEGYRILSSEWIDIATTPYSHVPETGDSYGYGYQIWLGEDSREILFNGMLGQNVWICPENNVIVVVNSANNELFQDSPTLAILRKYFVGRINDKLCREDIRPLHERERHFFDSRMWVRPLVKKRGFLYFLGLKKNERFDSHWCDLLGRYVFCDNNIGILPLIVRGLQNNLASSLESIAFIREGEALFMEFRESGVDYRVEVGFYGYSATVLDFRGEKYIVKVMGESIRGASGEREFRIEFLFPELPNTRMIKIIVPREDRIRVDFSELPDNRIIDEIVNKVPGESPVIAIAIGLLERGFGEDFINKRIGEAFNPALIGADMDYEGYGAIIDGEIYSQRERARTARLFRLIVNRFFKDEDEEEGGKARKFFLSELFSIIRSKEEKDAKNDKK